MFELVRLQQHRHAVVHFRNEFVRLTDDHRTRLQALTRLAIPPFIPKPRDRQHRRSITRCEIPGLLASRRVLPLVIARYGHEAALAPERLTENGLVVTVSTRALKVARRNSLSGFLHQNGTRPHRISTSARLLSCSTTVSAGSVGQA